MARIANHGDGYADERFQKMVELAQDISKVPLLSMGGFRAVPGHLYVTEHVRDSFGRLSVAYDRHGVALLDLHGEKILVSAELSFKQEWA